MVTMFAGGDTEAETERDSFPICEAVSLDTDH